MLCLALASAWCLGSSFAVVFGSGFGIDLVFRFEFRVCLALASAWYLGSRFVFAFGFGFGLEFRLGVWVLLRLTLA